jgi:hypothetical protein
VHDQQAQRGEREHERHRHRADALDSHRGLSGTGM